MLQIYYSMPSFVEKILKFPEQSAEIKGKTELDTKRIASGMRLIQLLQGMFAKMAVGNKCYVDPKPVLLSIVDNSGN